MKAISRHWTLLTLVLLLSINSILFREMLIAGKVPIAFDFAVATYQPWKLEFESRFKSPPAQIGHDDIRIFYPQRQLIVDSLSKGEIPFWNPYEFVGNVLLANSQTAVFYPPFLLFLLLPQKIAWSLLSFVIPPVVGMGTFLFLGKILKSKLAATFAALVFAFSSSIITRTEDGLVAGHSIIWLPWVLYGIELFLEKKSLRGIVLIIASLVFSMLAGWFQFTFYVYFVGCLYALFAWFVRGEKKARELLLITLAFSLSLLTTAFHWLPALEALRYSPRGVLGTPAEFSTSHLMPLSHLATLLVPNFFGHVGSNNYYGTSEFKEGVIAIGLTPFLLALVAILKRRKTGKQSFFIFLFVAAMILGLKTPIAETVVKLELPIVSTFLPNRVFLLASFSLAVLSAFGMQEIVLGRTRVLRIITFAAAGSFLLFYLAVAGIYWYEKFFAAKVNISFFQEGLERYLRISLVESIIPAIFLTFLLIVLLRSGKRLRLLISSLLLTTLVSQVIQADRYLYFSNVEHEFPTNPIFSFLNQHTRDGSRFLSMSFSKVPSNLPMYFDLYYPEGVDAMYPIWYGEFAQYFKEGTVEVGPLSRIEVSFSTELEKPKKIGQTRWIDQSTINFLSLIGIRYIVFPEEYHDLPPPTGFVKVFSHKWHTIYEYKYPFPKAYFVSAFTFSDDKLLTLKRIFHPEFLFNSEVVLAASQEAKATAILRESAVLKDNKDLDIKYEARKKLGEPTPFAAPVEALEEIEANPVKIIDYGSNQVLLEADVHEAGFIVLNDSYFPGWKAEIDGKPIEVLRANQAFRAIPIEPGRHQVTLDYRPVSFDQGLRVSAVSGATTLALAPALLLIRKRRRRNR